MNPIWIEIPIAVALWAVSGVLLIWCVVFLVTSIAVGWTFYTDWRRQRPNTRGQARKRDEISR